MEAPSHQLHQNTSIVVPRKMSLKGIVMYVLDSISCYFNLFRMYIQWTQACESEGYMLPKNAIAEFKKRISQAGKLGDKAKLNLSYCSLDDKRLISLVECLAQKPVIAKLDLRGNDFTDEVARMTIYFTLIKIFLFCRV